jgi:hypothetical protein
MTPGRSSTTPLRPQTFALDHIFDEQSSQTDLFDRCVAPLVDAAIAGYHSSVFAYGYVLAIVTDAFTDSPSDRLVRGKRIRC